jgi:hypothetical protein
MKTRRVEETCAMVVLVYLARRLRDAKRDLRAYRFAHPDAKSPYAYGLHRGALGEAYSALQGVKKMVTK